MENETTMTQEQQRLTAEEREVIVQRLRDYVVWKDGVRDAVKNLKDWLDDPQSHDEQ